MRQTPAASAAASSAASPTAQAHASKTSFGAKTDHMTALCRCSPALSTAQQPSMDRASEQASRARAIAAAAPGPGSVSVSGPGPAGASSSVSSSCCGGGGAARGWLAAGWAAAPEGATWPFVAPSLESRPAAFPAGCVRLPAAGLVGSVPAPPAAADGLWWCRCPAAALPWVRSCPGPGAARPGRAAATNAATRGTAKHARACAAAAAAAHAYRTSSKVEGQKVEGQKVEDKAVASRRRGARHK